MKDLMTDTDIVSEATDRVLEEMKKTVKALQVFVDDVVKSLLLHGVRIDLLQEQIKLQSQRIDVLNKRLEGVPNDFNGTASQR